MDMSLIVSATLHAQHGFGVEEGSLERIIGRWKEKVGWESERRDRGLCTLPPLRVVSW